MAIHIIDVKCCARCGEDHYDLVFHKLTRNVDDSGWTHWCTCPTCGEPILMKVIEETSDKEV